MNEDNFHDMVLEEEEYEALEEDEVVEEDENANPVPEEVKEKKELDKKGLYVIFIVLAIILSSLAILSGYSLYRNDKAPVIVHVHIESDNFDDHTIARYGNMVTLSFSFNKDLNGLPKVVIQNKEVEVFGNGKEYYAKFFIQDQDYRDMEITFSISEYKDAFYKVGTPVTSTTDGSKVIIPAIS